LENLRHCLPPSVRRTLNELPESLDETYERVLREIKKPNRDQALRLLQCLVVATRPLRVEELAEVLAVDFDDTAEEVPKLKANWRWEDQEQALLSSCSSLIAIIDNYNENDDGDEDNDNNHSRVVQFSHFSVKEFLTSSRLATQTRDVSHYHILLEPAHTIMAQACLSILLQLDDRVDQTSVGNNSPLAGYAARHWVIHAQFGNVSSYLRAPMERLFDPDQPYFQAWIKLYDIDTPPSISSAFFQFDARSEAHATPLYYAALCGLQEIAEHLILKKPQDVDASGGYCLTPFVAALSRRHFQVARLLHRNGSSVDTRGHDRISTLHSAAFCGDLEMIQVLLGDYKADINTRCDFGITPLCDAVSDSHPESYPEVVQFLLEHGADPNVLQNDGRTPLRIASKSGQSEIVRLLLEHGADVNLANDSGRTALQLALENEHDKVVELLSAHSAKGS
jgi:ankyrin repeat protein